ncbi:MAG: prepilin-type N-terminal cleavage/methylation domain-containing protein [Planctomycetota bacterium]
MHRFSNRSRRRRAVSGFTLLEVILALVVLGASVAIIGEVVRLSDRHAFDARLETQAQLLAVSVMDEMTAGSIDMVDAGEEPLETDDGVSWVYSVTLGVADLVGVIPVEVVVKQDIEANRNPVQYQLTRWLPDAPAETEEEEAANEQQEDAAAANADNMPS